MKKEDLSYYLAYVIWLVSFIMIPVGLFRQEYQTLTGAIVFFGWVFRMIRSENKGREFRNLSAPALTEKSFGKIILFSNKIGILVCFASLIALVAMGGYAVQEGQDYFIKNHSVIVKQISRQQYYLNRLFGALGPGGATCYMSSMMLGHEYVERETKNKAREKRLKSKIE